MVVAMDMVFVVVFVVDMNVAMDMVLVVDCEGMNLVRCIRGLWRKAII